VYQALLATHLGLGSLLNLILVWVHVRRSSFRNHLSNRFLMNLVAVNLVTCTLQIPLLLLDSLLPDLLNDKAEGAEIESNLALYSALCRTTWGLWVALSTGSMFSQLLIAIDQHLAVVQSLHYHSRINEKRCAAMSVSSWTLGTGLGFLAATVPSCSSLVFNSCSSATHSTQSTYHGDTRRMIVAGVGFVLPLVGIVSIYIRIFCEAHLNSERTRRNSVASTTLEAVNPGGESRFGPIPHYGVHLDVMNGNGCPKTGRSPSNSSITNGVRKMSSQLHHNVKLRINHAGAILKEGEGRTAKISVLAILLVICCWGPGYAIILADIVGISLTSFPNWAFRLVPQACGAFSVTLTPLLYGYRSRRIQQEIRKSLGLSFRRLPAGLSVRRGKGRRKNSHELKRMKSFSCPHLLVSAATETHLNIEPRSSDGGAHENLNQTSPTSNDQMTTSDSPMLTVKKFLVSRLLVVTDGPDSPSAHGLRRFSSNNSVAVRKAAAVMSLVENGAPGQVSMEERRPMFRPDPISVA